MSKTAPKPATKAPRNTTRHSGNVSAPAARTSRLPSAGSNIAATAPRGKIGVAVELLRRDQGATLADLMEATGWQAHSVRGAIAGAIKKKLGLMVTSTKTGAGRIYRIGPVNDAA